MEDGARRRRRPALVRLSVAADVHERAVSGVAGPPVVPDCADRRRRPLPRCGRRGMVARATFVRHGDRRSSRCRDSRGLCDRGRVLAHGRHRRAAHARRRRRPRADGQWKDRACRHRSRPGDRLQVPGHLSLRAACCRRLEAVETPCARQRASACSVSRVEPFRARAPEALPATAGSGSSTTTLRPLRSSRTCGTRSGRH